LNENRFSKYYCNKCAKEYYSGSPIISYESPNEELDEDVIFLLKKENTNAEYVII
jgi:hypothetical protein